MIEKFIPSCLFRTAAVSICAAAAALIQGQTPDFTVNTFENADEAAAWVRWWGAAPQTYEFDATMDAGASANSGSLKATVEFDLAAYAGDNQFALIGSFPEAATLDGSQYTNLVFDLRWDASSPTRAAGDFGTLEFGFRGPNFSQIWLGPISPYNIPGSASNGWVRVTAPINPGSPGIDQISGVVFKLWSGDPAAGFTGPAVFWVDNIRLIGSTTTDVPRPALTIEEARPGLRIFASGTGQYQRQNIRTVDPAFSWVGVSSPVTYSFTIADYPQATNNGFQTHLFLVPGSGLANTETSPDWNQPHLIFLDLQNTAEGTAVATFRYKTNSPAGNTMYYNANPANGAVGALASIGTPDIRGTWSLTFSGDTNVTLTTPSGSSTNFALPGESAALFADPLYAYLGIQPNRLENLGQSARFTRFQVSGIATPLDETFAGVAPDPGTPPNLDPAILERVAESAPGVVLVSGQPDFWLNWTVPAAGFRLQRADNLTGASWNDVVASPIQIGDRIRALVVAPGSPGFYRLVKE